MGPAPRFEADRPNHPAAVGPGVRLGTREEGPAEGDWTLIRSGDRVSTRQRTRKTTDVLQLGFRLWTGLARRLVRGRHGIVIDDYHVVNHSYGHGSARYVRRRDEAVGVARDCQQDARSQGQARKAAKEHGQGRGEADEEVSSTNEGLKSG